MYLVAHYTWTEHSVSSASINYMTNTWVLRATKSTNLVSILRLALAVRKSLHFSFPHPHFYIPLEIKEGLLYTVTCV
jgi:hypothetical protein